jgi:hypothetical protein
MRIPGDSQFSTIDGTPGICNSNIAGLQVHEWTVFTVMQGYVKRNLVSPVRVRGKNVTLTILRSRLAQDPMRDNRKRREKK